MLKVNNNYPRTITSAYEMLTRFELESPIRHHNERTGDKGNRGVVVVVVEGVIHSSNALHHWVQSSFQVSTTALHIALTVSIVISGEIVRISAQNPHETRRQITQDKI